MNKSSFVIGLSSCRQVGKDTLFNRLNTLSSRFRRFSLADRLKSDLAPFLLQHFEIDIWEADGKAKELVRPILIAYGMCQRERDEAHWIKEVIIQIDDVIEKHPDIIPVITDCRFVNEVTHLSSYYGNAFKLIHLTRDGAPEPTSEEMKHFQAVEELAHLKLHWGGNTLEGQIEHARKVCKAFKVAL